MVYVHLSSHLLFTGSDLHYSTYIVNTDKEQQSRIIYFDLIDNSGTSVHQWQEKIAADASNSMRISIPMEIESGIYDLRAYTRSMLSYPADMIFKTRVFIQLLQDIVPDSVLVIQQSDIPTRDNTGLMNSAYNAESGILELRFTEELQMAGLSVSLNQVSPLDSLLQTASFSETYEQFLLNSKKQSYAITPAERQGKTIRGKLVQLPDSKDLANKLVFLSFADTTANFLYTRTDSTGAFCFMVQADYDNRECYLQLAEGDCAINVAWLMDGNNINNDENSLEPVPLDRAQKAYLSQLKTRELISRIYRKDQKVNEKISGKSKPNFFQTPSMIIRPSDFIELDDFEDICNNILPPVRYRETEEGIQLGMVMNNKVIYGKSLVFLNGIPCLNLSYLSTLHSKDIERIELFSHRVMHGELSYQGIISIYTFNKGVTDKMFCSAVYRFDNNFHQAASGICLKPENEPLTENNIYWNPQMELKGEKSITIKLRKPDIGNTYCLRMNGLINNKPYSYQKLIVF